MHIARNSIIRDHPVLREGRKISVLPLLELRGTATAGGGFLLVNLLSPMNAIPRLFFAGFVAVLLASCETYEDPVLVRTGHPYLERKDFDGDHRAHIRRRPNVDPRLATHNQPRYYHPAPYPTRKDFDGDRRSFAHRTPIVNQVNFSSSPEYRRHPVYIQPVPVYPYGPLTPFGPSPSWGYGSPGYGRYFY